MISSLELEQAFAADAWTLARDVLHVNHGSFGACPRAVLEHQAAVRAKLEAATMRYFVLEWQDAADVARGDVAAFLGCDAEGLIFVPNATHGVATALANLRLTAGDEVLTTDHEYRACRNALDRAAGDARARVVIAPIPLPSRDPSAAVAAILDRVTARTRIVLVDHITSPTALVLDVAALARALPAHAVLLVDGAHAPGQLDLTVAGTGAAFYTGNFHKWTCAPKGSGFLWVAPQHRDGFRPLVTSHGATLPTDTRTRFRLEHDWTGAHDPSAYLSVPVAIETIARLGGGWPRVRERNRALARAMRDDLADALGADPIDQTPGPPLTTMASVAIELPDGASNLDVERTLLERGIEVPIVSHPGAPWPLVRISAHLYNRRNDAQRVAEALAAVGIRGRRI